MQREMRSTLVASVLLTFGLAACGQNEAPSAQLSEEVAASDIKVSITPVETPREVIESRDRRRACRRLR